MSTTVAERVRRLALSAVVALPFVAVIAADTGAAPVDVPRGINHAPFDSLLQKHVDHVGLVDYAAWKESDEDLKALSDYTAQFAAVGPAAGGHEKIAGLINAYNALTIQWILDHYPTASILSLNDSWTEARHRVGGRVVSLDEIEHDTLRPLVGFRIHAALVCAARSCPPLSNAAYTTQDLDPQLDGAMRRWLGRADLNQWLPERRQAKLSRIFKWYADDFEKAGGVRPVLAYYGPPALEEFFAGEYEIEYLPYHWGLNDQSDLGSNYGRRSAAFDYLKNLFR